MRLGEKMISGVVCVIRRVGFGSEMLAINYFSALRYILAQNIKRKITAKLTSDGAGKVNYHRKRFSTFPAQ